MLLCEPSAQNFRSLARARYTWVNAPSLDRIAQHGTCSVRFDKADVARLHAGCRQGRSDDPRLAVQSGRGIADLLEPSLLTADPLMTEFLSRE